MRMLAATAGLTDAELMARMQAGDVEAFDGLFGRYAVQARHVATLTRAGTASCDDVVQEAFLGIWRSRATYRAEAGTVRSWVLGIVRLRAIDAMRRDAGHDRRRDRHGAADQVPDPFDVQAVVGERDGAADLRAALRRLPDPQRDVLVLAYFGELSAAEIASQLSLPLGTVKGRMRLGLEKLRAGPSRLAAQA